MIKNNVYIKKLRMPAYNTRLWIVASTSLVRAFDVVEDLIDHRFATDADRKQARAYMYAYEDPNGKYHVIIFVKPNSKPGEIAHETKHALNLIFKWHGVMLSTHNDEHECYHLEWMIDRVHNSIKKYSRTKGRGVVRVSHSSKQDLQESNASVESGVGTKRDIEKAL